MLQAIQKLIVKKFVPILLEIINAGLGAPSARVTMHRIVPPVVKAIPFSRQFGGKTSLNPSTMNQKRIFKP